MNALSTAMNAAARVTALAADCQADCEEAFRRLAQDGDLLAAAIGARNAARRAKWAALGAADWVAAGDEALARINDPDFMEAEHLELVLHGSHRLAKTFARRALDAAKEAAERCADLTGEVAT